MSTEKNIAVICDYRLNPSRIGGMDRFFWAFDRALKLDGFEVFWYFSSGVVFGDYNSFEICVAGENSLEKTVLDAPHHFDVVITHFIPLCTSFFKAVKERGKPYITAVDHNPRPLEGFSLKKKIKNRIRGRLFSKYIDLFIGVSKYTSNCILYDFGSHLRVKTRVVYNGIETSVYLKREEENYGRFIVASHLRESKGIQDLIEALNLLKEEQKKSLKIDIFGEGPLEPYLKNKVKAYQLEQQISFKGSSSRLPELFKNYSFLLQPTYMECFSLSILESLAANVPVITTPVGGNPEIIKKGINGFLFPPGNVIALRDLLNELLLKSISIDYDVSREIENDYHLQRMVQEHISLLPCI